MKSIIGTIFLVAGIGLIWAFALPSWKNIPNHNDNIKEREEVLNTIKEKIDKKDALLAKYRQIDEDDRRRLALMVPSEREREQMLLMLQALVSEHNFKLSGLGFGQARNREDGYSRLNENFGVSGTYESFRVFLESIERIIRITDVTAISFSGGEVNNFNFSLNAQSYFLGSDSN